MIELTSNYNVSLGSLNARGLRDKNKRSNLFYYLRTTLSDLNILMIQETHASNQDTEFWGAPWPSFVYYSNLSSHAGGISFYIKKTILDFLTSPPTFLPIVIGRAVDCILNTTNETTHLINIYAPTHPTERETFFQTIEAYINNHCANDPIILGGDFNCVLDRNLDRLPNPNISEDRGITTLKNIIRNQSFQDNFREEYPQIKSFTCNSKSRIDRFYSSGIEGLTINTTQPVRVPVSTDHSLISLRISPPTEIKRGPGSWKANSELWKMEPTKNSISSLIG